MASMDQWQVYRKLLFLCDDKKQASILDGTDYSTIRNVVTDEQLMEAAKFFANEGTERAINVLMLTLRFAVPEICGPDYDVALRLYKPVVKTLVDSGSRFPPVVKKVVRWFGEYTLRLHDSYSKSGFSFIGDFLVEEDDLIDREMAILAILNDPKRNIPPLHRWYGVPPMARLEQDRDRIALHVCIARLIVRGIGRAAVQPLAEMLSGSNQFERWFAVHVLRELQAEHGSVDLPKLLEPVSMDRSMIVRKEAWKSQPWWRRLVRVW